MPILLTDIQKSYSGQLVIDRLSLELPDRGIVCLCGPSGSGKTTLFHLLAGLRRPDAGRIEGIEGKRVSVIFQEDRLLDWLTARQNVAAVLPKAEAGRAGEYLARLGLAEAAEKYPPELSGGMQRRVAIARALAYGFDVLLADEPFKGLDPAVRESVYEELRQAAGGALVLFITHDRQEAEALASRVISFSPAPLRVAEDRVISRS